ncbi:MAG: ATP synthase F1 subunit gamma [Candidatus Poribacteria bacterium]|nr:ATP synthase F1 subunit gamma [Candidatus Poribacteria bacterium]
MATLRQIRRRIKGVQNIQRITKAMRMVATARLRRAQERVLSARPYAEALDALTERLIKSVEEYDHPYLRQGESGGRLLIAVTGDRGLCGAFNSVIVREAMDLSDGEAEIAAVGSRGADALERRGANVVSAKRGFFKQLEFENAQQIAQEAADAFAEERVDAVDVVFNRFRSALHQEVTVKRLLPVSQPEESAELAPPEIEHLYEPSRGEVLDQLLPKQLEIQVWQALLESNAAEQAARMNAMENASRSASDMIDELILERNRVRQAVITKEISEIVGGAEALKS